MLCLRVAALYNDVRWVIWSLRVGFVIFQGTCVMASLLAIIAVSGEYLYHHRFSRLISVNTAGMKYSPIGGQCLPGSTWKLISSAPAYVSISCATILDLFLLVLTIAKALKSTAISKSHPSSPIECVALDFGSSLKLILRPPSCARYCATKFCMWTSEPLRS